MHDCYEDCPFYEQLQYAMDTRSSALFTYCVSGDDRLARQAIIQIHTSFSAHVGLTQSRAPTHKPQFIPHFSLYGCCMVSDHMQYFNDKQFVARFIAVIDAVLGYFHALLDNQLGLMTSELRAGIWNFVDWTEAWKPHGIPPCIARTGVSTFANQLYAYTLDLCGDLVQTLGRPGIGDEYRDRAATVRDSLRKHCFDGSFFTDTVTSASTAADYSHHCQTWAVLCGSVKGSEAQELLTRAMGRKGDPSFTTESIAMSFYRMRALSKTGGSLYNGQYDTFWDPWRRQLQRNMTTWVEDEICQRSDCHAWACVPLFEFIAEVAGVTPARPGWEVIRFQPRIALYPRLKARVSLAMVAGKVAGWVDVSWERTASGDVEVSMRVELERERGKCISILVALPGAESWVKAGSEPLMFTVRATHLR
jgi:hypothetical protein